MHTSEPAKPRTIKDRHGVTAKPLTAEQAKAGVRTVKKPEAFMPAADLIADRSKLKTSGATPPAPIGSPAAPKTT